MVRKFSSTFNNPWLNNHSTTTVTTMAYLQATVKIKFSKNWSDFGWDLPQLDIYKSNFVQQAQLSIENVVGAISS